MKPLSRLLVALCLSPLLAQAAPMTQVTLPDGRQVQLNDDFTWEYLLIKPTASGERATGAVAVPVLTEQAMTNPDLLAQAVKDGIGVKLDKVEGMTLDKEGTLFVVTDNDGVDDSSGETQFFALGKIAN